MTVYAHTSSVRAYPEQLLFNKFMKVQIKKFNVEMPVGSSGIEFEIRTPDNSGQLGDCFLTMSGLTWCEGRTRKAKGVKISWDNFMAIARSNASVEAAVKAARSVQD